MVRPREAEAKEVLWVRPREAGAQEVLPVRPSRKTFGTDDRQTQANQMLMFYQDLTVDTFKLLSLRLGQLVELKMTQQSYDSGASEDDKQVINILDASKDYPHPHPEAEVYLNLWINH